MKILRVTSDLYPAIVGGLGIHAHDMSSYQSKLGHDVTVYTSQHPKLKNNKLKPNYEIITFRNDVKILGNGFCFRLFNKLKDNMNKFDIIHAHSHLFFYTNFCALAKTHTHTPPLIITNHGIRSASAPEWFNSAYMQTIGKWTLNSANMIICYTQNEKSYLQNIYKINQNKISVIPNGINTEIFHPTPNRCFKGNTILWVGRFVNGKGVKFLIQATRIILQEIPDLKVLLVGEGPEKSRFEKYVKTHHLDDFIKFYSFIPYEKMPDIYNSVDLFVLPSLNEGVPKTMLEAMACGKPVVMTRFEHLAETLYDCGLTFPKGDVSSLADQCIKTLQDKKFAEKLGNCGCTKVRSNHSWANTVKRTVELYEKVI